MYPCLSKFIFVSQMIWAILDITPTQDKKAIRQAYAKQLVLKNPEVDPEGFKELRAAYESALSGTNTIPAATKESGFQPSYLPKARHVEFTPKTQTAAEEPSPKPSLKAAIDKGDLQIVRMLCEAGADSKELLFAAVVGPNEEVLKYFLSHPHLEKDPEALRLAIITHQPKRVRLLVEAGFEIAPKDSKEPFLITAARLNDLECVDYLLEKGADPDQMDAEGRRAVVVAAERGSVQIVERLLQKDTGPFTPALVVDAAMRYSHFPIVKMILDRLDLSFVDQIKLFAGICGQGHCYGFTSWMDEFYLHLETQFNRQTFTYSPVEVQTLPPLFQAIYRNDLHCFKELLAQGADLHQTLVNGFAALHMAIFLQRHEHFDLLLERGVDIDQVAAPYFLSPLFVAVNRQNAHAYRALMDKGAKDLPSCCQHTALFAAVYRNDLQAARELISRGSNLQQYAGDGYRTLIFAAVRYQNQEMLKLLLSCGLHPDAVFGEPGAPFCVNYTLPGRYPVTPLALAIKNHDEAMIRLLLEAGADPNRKANGIPPLHFAMLDNTFFPASETPGYYQIIEKSHAIINLLIKQGADIHAKSDDGRTFLSKAIWIGPIETVIHLVESGADIRLADDDGKLPIDQAKATKRSLLIKYLQSFYT